MDLRLAQNLDDWAADWPDSLCDWKLWATNLSKLICSNSPLSVDPDLKSTLAIKEYGTFDSVTPQLHTPSRLKLVFFTFLAYGAYVHKKRAFFWKRQPAYQILDDLKQIYEFVQKRSLAPPIALIRLSGLQEVRRPHGESLIQYRTSVRAMQDTLNFM
jgi:hypothetical protein